MAVGITVKIIMNDKGNPPGKLADAEINFVGGPLDGLKLIGFSVWASRDGRQNVTFPARSYAVNGERRSFALLRPVGDYTQSDKLKALILEDYATVAAAQLASGAEVETERDERGHYRAFSKV